MGTSEKIRMVLIKRQMKMKDLAEALHWSRANLSNKMKRDNFSERELTDIAKALGCDYEAHFVLRDTGERF